MNNDANNPERILRTLDSYLERPTRIVMFGRAALAMGFPAYGDRFSGTQDVDAILPVVELPKIEADEQFWKAIESTNRALESEGLYITHLFTDQQVILTGGWTDRLFPVCPGRYRNLELFRPSAIDLILTKMMRNDLQDIADIRFLIERERVSPRQLQEGFDRARIPEIAEIRAIFEKMKLGVLEMARSGEQPRGVSEPGPLESGPAKGWIADSARSLERERSRERDLGWEL